MSLLLLLVYDKRSTMIARFRNNAFAAGNHMLQKSQIKILEVGTDGGSLEIVRKRNREGAWRFFVERNEVAIWDMLSEDDRIGFTAIKTSGDIGKFEDALALSDPSQWFRLCPIAVHADYLDRILREVEKHGGQAERSRWQKLLAHGSNGCKPVGSILTGTEDIVSECLFGMASVGKKSYKHLGQARLLAVRPPQFDAEQMLRRLIEQIQTTLKNRCPKSESVENWRETAKLQIGGDNKSKEVCLERKIAELKLQGWWNQMPIASGLVHPQADRRTAIDLVHDCGDGDNEFDFIELKIESDTPLYALMEIALYGLVYLVLRDRPDYLSPVSRDARVFKARKINLRVLAPKEYFQGFQLGWLQTELDQGLNTIADKLFPGSLTMSLSSHWPNALERWDGKILTDQDALSSVLNIGRWNDAYRTS